MQSKKYWNKTIINKQNKNSYLNALHQTK